MKKRWACGFIILLVSTVAGGAPLGAPVPGTGQTKCYDNNVEIACPSPGNDFFGQDGNYRAINRMSYTKLDERGSMLPDSAASWSMVRDNVTGLIWEHKSSYAGDYANPHDGRNEYFWYDKNPATNGGETGMEGIGHAWKPWNRNTDELFVTLLNAAGFGGHSDWRMPTVKELATLVHYERSGPAIDDRYFTNTAAGQYWTSTTVAGNPSVAWYVDFENGAIHMGGKYVGVTAVRIPSNPMGISVTLAPTFPERFARAVRGGRPAGYTDHGGTVTDGATDLTWQKTGPPAAMRWQEALAYCESLKLGGRTNWRLPNIKELLSLVDYEHVEPSIDTASFPGTASAAYWSSTTAKVSQYGTYFFNRAWAVDFTHGGTADRWGASADYHSLDKRMDAANVRCVSGPTVECIATMDTSQTIRIPLLEHVSLTTRWSSADLIDPSGRGTTYQLEERETLQQPSFSCEPARMYSSTGISGQSSHIHIPDVLLADGITHLWLDLEYSQNLGLYSVTNGGVVPKSRR